MWRATLFFANSAVNLTTLLALVCAVAVDREYDVRGWSAHEAEEVRR